MSDSNVGQHKKDRHKDPQLRVHVGQHTLDRLNRLAEAGGYTVTDIVKFCLEHTLPKLEEKHKLAV